MNVLHFAYRSESGIDGITSTLDGIILLSQNSSVSASLVTFVCGSTSAPQHSCNTFDLFSNDSAEVSRVNVLCCPLSVFGCLRLFLNLPLLCFLIKVIRKCDIVHFHGLWSPYFSLLACFCFFLRAPYVWSLHGMLSPACTHISAIKKRFAWILYQKTTLRLASSVHYSSLLERQVSFSLFSANRYAVIPNNVVPCHMPLRSSGSEPSLGNKQIIFLGRLHPIKNLETLLEAWELVSSSRHGWKLLIAGPDQNRYSDKLQSIMTRLYISDSVQIIPPVTGGQKYALLDSSSFLILPSYSENFGNVVPEALSRGLPVIVSSRTPWVELDELGCGLVVDPDVESLSRSLITCFCMASSMHSEMSRKAIQVYHEKYSCKALSAMYSSFYSNLRL